MTEEWYYAKQEHLLGPVTLGQLRELLANGEVARADLVWRQGMTNWAAAETVGELFTGETAPAPVVAATIPYSTPQIEYYNPTGAVMVYAGFWLRFWAWFIDWIILSVAGRVVAMSIPAVVRLPLFNFGRPMPVWTIVLAAGSLPALLMGWLYYALMESSPTQATVGKMALGLVVTDLEGKAVTFARATGRYFGKIISQLIFGIGFLMAGFTDKRQALHDIIANTLVVRRSLPRR